jgi:hypothetical protein
MSTICESSYRRFATIISQITYKPGWHILLRRDAMGTASGHSAAGAIFVQLYIDETSDASLDSQKRDGTRVAWKSGKRYLSAHMSRQEVVGVVFDLIKGAELHETREWFRYRGASIYNPHLDPDVLVTVASKASSFNTRLNAMTMDEGGDVTGPQPATNANKSAPSPQSNWR